MFPFSLAGPPFLLFFVVFAAVCIVVARRSLRAAEDGLRPKLALDDPYRIAYLRAGPHEALRVAAVSLYDRGLLQVDGERLVAASDGSAALARRRIEQIVLACCARPVKIGRAHV